MHTSLADVVTSPASAEAPGPKTTQTLTQNAVKLLQGGMIGLHILVLALIIGLAVSSSGTIAIISALLGAVLGLVYYIIGQGVQVFVAGYPAPKIFVATLGSYIIRAVGLGVLLLWLFNNPLIAQEFSFLHVAAGVGVAVLGWLVGLAFTYRKLRVLVFDEAEEPPANQQMVEDTALVEKEAQK